MEHEILKEISSLLSDDKLTWDKCNRLSVLYGALQSVLTYNEINKPKEETESLKNNVSKELGDILPALSEYLKTKDDFRQGKVNERAVVHFAEKLTVEINEFINSLKAHATDTERQIFMRIK